MNNINELLRQLDEQEEQIKLKRKALLEIQPKLEGFKHDINLSFGYSSPPSIDFDYLDRSQTIDFITYFKAGKWDKEISSAEGKIDYKNTTSTVLPLRIYGVEPPQSCKIVGELYEIPAQPARVGTRKKIVCPKGALNT